MLCFSVLFVSVNSDWMMYVFVFMCVNSQKALEGLKGYASDQFDDIRHMTQLIKSLRQELALQKKQARQKEEILTRSQHELTKARKDNSVLLVT